MDFSSSIKIGLKKILHGNFRAYFFPGFTLSQLACGQTRVQVDLTTRLPDLRTYFDGPGALGSWATTELGGAAMDCRGLQCSRAWLVDDFFFGMIYGMMIIIMELWNINGISYIMEYHSICEMIINDLIME